MLQYVLKYAIRERIYMKRMYTLMCVYLCNIYVSVSDLVGFPMKCLCIMSKEEYLKSNTFSPDMFVNSNGEVH